MVSSGNPRKKLLRAACALAGLTVEEWAREADVSTGHLYAYFRGQRESAAMDARIDEYAARFGLSLDRVDSAAA